MTRAEPAPGRWYGWGLAASTALFGTVLVLWALLTPGFRAPDEPQHLNSVMRVASGGGWPDAGEALVSRGTRTAVAEAGFVLPDRELTRMAASRLPQGLLPGGGYDFVDLDPGPVDERSAPGPAAWAEPATGSPVAVDQMTQHPPGYYYLAAGVVRAVGALDWRWDHVLLLLRLVDAFLVVWVAPLAAGITRLASGSRAAGLVAAASVVGLGQFSHISSAVTNDALTTLAAAAVLYCVAAVLARPPRPLLAGVTGVALGVGLLSKAFLLAAIPVVALAFALAPGLTWARRALLCLLALGTAFVVGGWWWARNLLVHGALQPRGMSRTMTGGHADPQLGTYLREAWVNLRDSFWSNLGWLEVAALPQPVIQVATAVALLSVVGAAAVAPRRVLVLAALPALVALAVVADGAMKYLGSGNIAGLQGRYLFVGVPVLLACVGIVVTWVSARLPRPVAAVVRLAPLPVAGALGAYTMLHALEAFYRQPGEPIAVALARWEAWSPVGREALTVIAVAAVLAAVAALWLHGTTHLRLLQAPERHTGRRA